MWPKKPKEMPRVKAVMTPFPYSVETTASLQSARKMMDDHDIHHLPVVDEGQLVGVVSRGDLERAASSTAQDAAGAIGEIVSREPYVISLAERLDKVLIHMAEHGHDAALVVKEGRLAGIFTATDACRSFAESLRQQFGVRGDDEVA